jgi:hypothetical protein
MARQEDPELTQAQIKHLEAQDVALAQAAQQEAARTAIAQQEQGTRAAAQQQAAREGEAKISQEQEMTPFQQMLSLSQAGAPAIQDRANKVRAAVDIYQTMAQGKVAREQIQSAQQIEAGREKGALARQQEVTKSNVMDTIATHAPALGIDTATLREAFKRQGYPALADAYEAVREPQIQVAVDTLKPQLQAMHKLGKLDMGLQGVTDPDVKKRLQPFIDEMRKTSVAPTPTFTPPVSESRELARRKKTPPLDEMLKWASRIWHTPAY